MEPYVPIQALCLRLEIRGYLENPDQGLVDRAKEFLARGEGEIAIEKRFIREGHRLAMAIAVTRIAKRELRR